MYKIRRLFFFLLIVIVLMGASLSCIGQTVNKNDVYQRVRLIVEPYAFDFVSWEVQAMYFLVDKRISPLEQEERLRSHIEAVLSENGIAIFPPLNFKLEKPPQLLVISPRDRIFYLDRVILRQNLGMDDIERIEAEVDKLGVSSLVEELGGFGATYPPIVDGDARLTFVIEAVVEEWLHQYLAFRPLGALYVLDSIGFVQDPNIIVMNETLAGMVSDEIGSEVYNRYYSAQEQKQTAKKSSDFDFSVEIRQTRSDVDRYLSQGDITGAERYMEERRQVFLLNGYKMRKLNQAYFAFHGIYARDPASVSPIHRELKQIRTESASLKDFLHNVSGMTSYADLIKALKR